MVVQDRELGFIILNMIISGWNHWRFVVFRNINNHRQVQDNKRFVCPYHIDTKQTTTTNNIDNKMSNDFNRLEDKQQV